MGKVDTHVHHSAYMNQKQLLRFIKHKVRGCPDVSIPPPLVSGTYVLRAREITG